MELLEELLHRLPVEWLLGCAVILVALNQTGIVQRFFQGRAEERIAERKQTSEDAEDLLDRLQQQVEQEHSWRISDAEYYQKQITVLREELAKRDETIAHLSEAATLSERGNARLRHALDNVFQHVAILLDRIKSAGISAPPYEGWRNMLGLSPDLDANLRRLFETAGVEKRNG